MKLSDAFGGDDAVELKVEFLNINAGFNRELIEQSGELTNYCTFVDRVEGMRRDGVKLRIALRETIDYCIANGIMAEYFLQNYWEVVEMYEDEYNIEIAKRVRYEEGKTEGIEIGKLKMVGDMLKVGTPMKYIELATGWTKDQILEAASEPLN